MLINQRNYRVKCADRTDAELEAVRSKVSELKCSICLQVLPISEFPFNRSKANGYHNMCRSCCGSGKRRTYQREWQRSNPERVSSYAHRRRILKLGTLTEWDLRLSAAWRKTISKMPCYYCGTTDAESYHVDHRIPVSKGGDDSWVNLVRACESCNLSKSAKTDAEFFGWKESE